MKTMLKFSLCAFFIFTSFLGFSQPNAPKTINAMLNFNGKDYAAAWKNIDSLDKVGQYKSALPKVMEVLAQATTDKNPAQQVKALTYKAKYDNALNENGYEKTILAWETATETAVFPVKPMMQSMLAEMYERYLENNYWKATGDAGSEKTMPLALPNLKKTSCSVRELNEYTFDLYQKSLQYDDLKLVKIADFGAVLYNKKHCADLQQPTLYDYLAQRALNFCINERHYLDEPSYKFEIDDAKLFDLPSDKTILKTPKDSTSRKFRALKLLNELFLYHKNDAQPEALLDVELKRLDFLYNNCVLPDKKTIYFSNLQILSKKNEKNEGFAEIAAKIAQVYIETGQNYNPLNDKNTPDDKSHKFDLKKAKEILDGGISKYPNSYGADLCNSLRINILNKQLMVQTENVYPINETWLCKLSYKNVGKAFYAVKKYDKTIENELIKSLPKNYSTQQYIEAFVKLPTIASGSLNLPDDGDFQEHSIEFGVKGLPSGTYKFLVSDTETMTGEKNAIAYDDVNVSNLAYTLMQNKNGSSDIFVVNRVSGEPQKDVTIILLREYYNSETQKYETKEIKKTKTDNNGKATSSLPNENYKIWLEKGEDKLHLNDYNSDYEQQDYERQENSIEFFLDRKIYRPGQTVYFKAMALRFDKKGLPSIITKKKLTVQMNDANGQKVSSLELVTKDFGTCNGSFTAPTSGLLGQMGIQSVGNNTQGYIDFRVEEYKRPRFEVTVDTLKGAYRLNDKVEITAIAKNFAGNAVDGASVKYRVTRSARYPYLDYYWSRWFRPSSSQEIEHGESVTDAEGKCKINFMALPDKTIDPATKPLFDYTVSIDVTDITGETHNFQKSVSVGYIALLADIEIKNVISKNSNVKIPISTTNTNQIFEAAKVEISIAELKTPKTIYKPRYWDRPDKQVLSKSEFATNFPFIAYEDEDEVAKWDVGKQVLNKKLDTKDTKYFEISNLNTLKTGKYILTLATEDKFGEKISLKKYFTIVDYNEKQVASNDLFWKETDGRTLSPNKDIAINYFGSKANGKVLYRLEENNKIIDTKWLDLKGLNSWKNTIEETHRGNNLSVHLMFFAQNRIENVNHTYNVPWDNKNLTIKYETFRDKLQPGADEEWRISIKGAKNDLVLAEMLAAMYDASLDEFAPNSYSFNPFPLSYSQFAFSNTSGYSSSSSSFYQSENWQQRHENRYFRHYREHNWFGFSFGNTIEMYEPVMSMAADIDNLEVVTGGIPASLGDVSGGAVSITTKGMKANATKNVDAIVAQAAGVSQADEGKGVSVRGRTFKADELPAPGSPSGGKNAPPPVKVRTNLNETVFFFPNLMTDANGNIILKFKMNEALTRWKFLGLAHTKSLESAVTEKEIVTQKDLMVIPNPPRFFREGDQIEFVSKVVNLNDTPLSGTVKLELEDAISGKSVLDNLITEKSSFEFTANAKQSTAITWKLKIPSGFTNPVLWRVVATAGAFSDGEENVLPVLTNKTMVVETMPLPIRGGQEKTFSFKTANVLDGEKNKQTNVLPLSEGVSNKIYTLEFTANPAWYAVQSLPYLMEYPYECTEQVFSRYYSNTLAASMANGYPKIKKVFEAWKGTDALKSNLSKNQELKTALLSETPWVMNAESEAQQRKNIGLLFDLNKMASEQAAALKKISERQLSNGGFAWFTGGRDDWYITQYLVEGFGRLKKLKAKNEQTNEIITKAVLYCDKELVENYEKLLARVAQKQAKLEDDNLGNMEAHYLYARSFFKDIPQNEATKKAADYYLMQAEKFWIKGNEYNQGMLALAMNRNNSSSKTAQLIAKSLKERSLNSEEMGMYWKYPTGYYWHQAPIETHALLIEVFDEVAKDAVAVDDLKTWLLKNRQTNSWKTTKATASACYALLKTGANWLAEDKNPNIQLGNYKIEYEGSATAEKSDPKNTRIVKPEAGTGNFKTTWRDSEITPDMATIKVKNNNKAVAWGAVYWQYLEEYGKIKTFQATPLKIKKTIIRSDNTDFGAKTTEISANDVLKVGDKVMMRIEISVDRDMEYVHLKDGRPAGFEPSSVTSSYKWQGGLGYYQETRDASTNFFFGFLPKGNYVLEYPLTVQHKGSFSAGIATAQCMYAPEFTAHTEGITVQVK